MNFSHLDFRLKRSFKAFGLVHVLVLFMATSIILVTSLSIVFKKSPSVNDKYVMGCILNNASGITFNNISGDITSYPTSGECFTAYNGCKQGNTEICDSLFYYADGHGTANQQISALKILRATCDQGGEAGCNYFLNRCVKGSAECLGPDEKYSLNYYLGSSSNSTVPGLSYIKEKAGEYYNWNITAFNSDINTKCTCPGSSAACEVLGCYTAPTEPTTPPTEPTTPTTVPDGQTAITDCNNGNTTACTTAYNNSWNRTCKQIKTTWTSAANANYKLTYGTNGNGTSFSTYCDMTVDGGGWTMVWQATSANMAVATTPSQQEYVSGTQAIAQNAAYALIGYTNSSSNAFISSPWKFNPPTNWKTSTPFKFTDITLSTVTATRTTDNTTVTDSLVYGNRDIGGVCNDPPGGTYNCGIICLRKSTDPKGAYDFPFVDGYASTDEEACSYSNQYWDAEGVNSCNTKNRRLIIFMRE